MRRLAIIFAVLILVVVGGAAGIAAWRWLGATEPAPSASSVDGSPIASVDGLPVWTVSQAVVARPGLDETEPVAVAGWYVEAPPHSCPAPAGPNGQIRQLSPVELYCRRGEILLMERPEAVVTVVRTANSMSVSLRTPSGPYLDPALLGFATDRDLAGGGDRSSPHQIVAVGHFADHTAVHCLPEDLPFCLRVFAIDHVAAIGAEATGPTRYLDTGSPHRATADSVGVAVRAARGSDATVLTIAGLDSGDQTVGESGAKEPETGRPIWLVRLIDRGADGTESPKLVTLVLDDATLAIRWSSDVPD